jgi:FixJ family two-component response regulator
MSGMELLEVLRGRHVTIPVIIVTAFGDVSAAVRSMKLGAVDFIQKPYDRDDLLAKIQRALEHDAVRRSQLDKIEAARQRLAELSEREKELLARLVAGKSSKLIAMELSISLRTVENHRSRLLAKTGAANTADLVRLSLIASLPTTVE